MYGPPTLLRPQGLRAGSRRLLQPLLRLRRLRPLRAASGSAPPCSHCPTVTLVGVSFCKLKRLVHLVPHLESHRGIKDRTRADLHVTCFFVLESYTDTSLTLLTPVFDALCIAPVERREVSGYLTMAWLVAQSKIIDLRRVQVHPTTFVKRRNYEFKSTILVLTVPSKMGPSHSWSSPVATVRVRGALCRVLSCGILECWSLDFPQVHGLARLDVRKHPWSLPGPRGDGNGRSAPVVGFLIRLTSDTFPWSLYRCSPLSSWPQPLGSGGDATPRKVTREERGSPFKLPPQALLQGGF